MCGICGIVSHDPVDPDTLERMTRTLQHRGPDDQGTFVQEGSDVGVGLGFRRLAIIDLVSGNQPLENETGSVHVVANGELYNYRELRSELEDRGHRFATNSDIEVLPHLYEDHGPACFGRINGMFAAALWDADKRELVLGRDRFGKKPLYYVDLGDGVLFGSELKALLQHPRCPRELDFDSLGRYLTLEYVPTPRSIFSRIRKLPGGHVLRWRQGTTVVEPYWDLSFRHEAADAASEDDYAEEFESLLEAAVRRRLMSDVPLGAFLSGGIDSSAVVAMMARALPAGAVKTFTIGFGERSFDESDHARRVAAHFGTDHHEEMFTPAVMLDLLPRVVDVLDEPFADASVLPTYLLSRFTREHVTVALGGDGSDELLAGYPTFTADRLARFYPVPRGLHERTVVPLVNRLPVSTKNFSLDFKAKRFVQGATLPTAERHASWLGAFLPEELPALLGDRAVAEHVDWQSVYGAAPSGDATERLIYAYAKTYLQDDILVKVDRASMANSLEVRAPFLDVNLVEFLGRVPPGLKLRRLRTKYLLKRAMADVLPPGIADRPKKGFGIPIAEWFKGPLREPLLDELSPDRLRAQGIFEPVTVGRIVDDHMAGRRDERKALWTLFVFQLWHRRWASAGQEAGAAQGAGAATP